ncbi:histidine kinase [Aquabacterium fontiphilum]|uniref:sensor histidine kinase n=1 Tax=Aquabacterium fontiphilum TaxID=450365 RepID=UPI001377C970|nr:ATP-binding protein [Aquabacterium fontiphilum]NBD19301.1 histidine kinase [Aquabacterium fontiphilum]
MQDTQHNIPEGQDSSVSPRLGRMAVWARARAGWIGLALVSLVLAAITGSAVWWLSQSSGALTQPSGASREAGVQELTRAWSVVGEQAVYPLGAVGRLVMLPDEWARSHPGHQGAVWYRFLFDAPPPDARADLLALHIERACSAVEVHLNGQLLYRSGRLREPVARQCHRPHLVPLPSALMQGRDNQLDLKVVGYPLERVTARERAGGLAGVKIGPLPALRSLHEAQVFWTSTVSQVLGGVLLVLGAFALGLAWVRRLPYLVYFGLLTIGWALSSGRFWAEDWPVPNAALELLVAFIFAPMTGLAVQFLLGYAGDARLVIRGVDWRRRIVWGLWAQCLLFPLTVLVAGESLLFLVTRVWFTLFALELFTAITYFLWVAGRGGRVEFWLMSVALGAVAAVVGIELAFQFGWLQVWGVHITHLVMPLLYAAVAVRLIQVYARALQTAEGARVQLEKRVQEISIEIERNFTQIAELRVEQIAERERKRIAADLHDDLGAKLLTIVHTSDNDRISTLAREALEEMRLSVRGLTGRPMVLSDALADWRSEVVSRLGQAGIECEWRNPNDTIEEPLSSRTYVQTTRIVREAVSNIIKHSAASHVIISADVNLEQHDFVLVIQDNGRGIPLELDGRLDRGHGMTTMKHRAKQLNGQCLVESGPGFGTVIRLTLPLEIASVQQVRAHAAPGSPPPASMEAHTR